MNINTNNDKNKEERWIPSKEDYAKVNRDTSLIEDGVLWFGMIIRNPRSNHHTGFNKKEG